MSRAAIGQSLVLPFTTRNVTTGALTDADALPTGTLYLDGVASGATVTVASRSGDGKYTASVTIPTTSAKRWEVEIDATVNSVSDAGAIASGDVVDNAARYTPTSITAEITEVSGT